MSAYTKFVKQYFAAHPASGTAGARQRMSQAAKAWRSQKGPKRRRNPVESCPLCGMSMVPPEGVAFACPGCGALLQQV